MPNLTQTQRNFRYFRIAKTTVIAGLGLPSVLEWSTDGQGRNLYLMARIADQIEPGIPIPQIDRITERWILTPWEDIRQQWFAAYPPATFDGLSITSDTTYLYFNLNREEA